ncbi:MAG TPA: hypothetical protein VK753_06480 [Xanthomonadaceae bacterium]|jgi:general secretion pathway protein N|nr:hypothetical protein [Xanthomonadaceae bacterium]
MLRRLEPLSWLLVAIAGWALACAIIALSGFGGRYTLLPDNPSLVPGLPATPTMGSRSTMGPLDAYAEAFNHPLFFPDRKPAAAHVPGQNNAAAAQPLDVVLTSVIMTPTLQMAIVQDPKSKASLRVREGQPIGGAYAGWKLTGLSPRSATFDSDSQGQTTLDLRVYDGHGGEEPTRMGLTPQVVASGALNVARQPADADASPDQKGDAQPEADNADAASQAGNVAAQAAQQAEEIRRRIELRRQQAQSQRAANNKDR